MILSYRFKYSDHKTEARGFATELGIEIVYPITFRTSTDISFGGDTLAWSDALHLANPSPKALKKFEKFLVDNKLELVEE